MRGSGAPTIQAEGEAGAKFVELQSEQPLFFEAIVCSDAT